MRMMALRHARLGLSGSQKSPRSSIVTRSKNSDKTRAANMPAMPPPITAACLPRVRADVFIVPNLRINLGDNPQAKKR